MPMDIERNEFFEPEQKRISANSPDSQNANKNVGFQRADSKTGLFTMIPGQKLHQTSYSCGFCR
jgi:hypothetical protein